MDYAENLKSCYEEIFSNWKPQWAQKMKNGIDVVPPTIPFVGNNYQQSKVLIYASAENLTGYSYKGWLEGSHIETGKDIDIRNRHRSYFDNQKLDKEKKPLYFPYGHCTPINDGSLIIACAYICKKLNIPTELKNPRDFLEQVAFANFGKFSIHTDKENKKNIDYAGKVKYLKASFDYIEQDLSILKPEYIIMPKTIYDKKTVRKKIKEVAPNAKIFPIYQINTGVVNRTIKPNYESIVIKEIDEDLKEWYEHLGDKLPDEPKNGWSGDTKENYYYVFPYLDKIEVV